MAKKYQEALLSRPLIKDNSLIQHEAIKKHIQILPELESLIAPLTTDEYNQLEQNILKNGCRDALLVWETNSTIVPGLPTVGNSSLYVLIDGHNRYSICQKHGIGFNIYLLSFASLEDVKYFMVDLQLGRRNLSTEQIAYYRGLRYNQVKQNKGTYVRDFHTGHFDQYDQETDIASSTEEKKTEAAVTKKPKLTTAAQLSEAYKVSEKTIRRDAEFAKGLDRLTPELKKEILNGHLKVDKQLIQELGKIDEFSHSLATIEQIQQKVQERSMPAVTIKPTSLDQAQHLTAQLNQLIGKLKHNKTNKRSTYQAIKDTAQQLLDLIDSPAAN